MLEPKIPENENIRLKALHDLGILDTEANEYFDRITQTAKMIFKVSGVLISLVDANRQWFKSKCGIEESELPRTTSFCGHAILQNDLFYIPDTLKDSRFHDNPLVVNHPQIRFYAGYPLATASQLKIGTFCLFDLKPRKLTEEDKLIITNLALITEHQINSLTLTTIDELTTVLNRRGFNLNAKKRLELCKNLNLDISVIIIDLNKFKFINDNFGHEEGDKAITTFVKNLKEVLDISDIIARLGGDEFAVLIAGRSIESIKNQMITLKQKLHSYNSANKLNYDIDFSYGIATKNANDTTISDLLSLADKLMYKNKKILAT